MLVVHKIILMQDGNAAACSYQYTLRQNLYRSLSERGETARGCRGEIKQVEVTENQRLSVGFGFVRESCRAVLCVFGMC